MRDFGFYMVVSVLILALVFGCEARIEPRKYVAKKGCFQMVDEPAIERIFVLCLQANSSPFERNRVANCRAVALDFSTRPLCFSPQMGGPETPKLSPGAPSNPDSIQPGMGRATPGRVAEL